MPLFSLLGPILGLVCAGHLVRDGYLRRTVSPTESYPLSSMSRSHSATSRRRRHHDKRSRRKARLIRSTSSEPRTRVHSSSPHAWSRSRTPSSRILLDDKRRAQQGHNDADHGDSPTWQDARRASRMRGRYYAQHAPYQAQSPDRTGMRSNVIDPATVASMTAAAAATVAAVGLTRTTSPELLHRRIQSPRGTAPLGRARTISPSMKPRRFRSPMPDLETGLKRVPTVTESVGTACTSSTCDDYSDDDTSSDSVQEMERGRTWSRERDLDRARQRDDRKEWRRLRDKQKTERQSDELAVSEGKN